MGAAQAPRFSSYAFPNSFAPHEYFPQLLKLEARIPPAVRTALEAQGHSVEVWPGGDFDWAAGAMCVLERSGDGSVIATGADPRRACYAAGW